MDTLPGIHRNLVQIELSLQTCLHKFQCQ